MVLYSSPLDLALASAFEALDHSLSSRPSRHVFRTTTLPNKMKSLTVRPRYSIRSDEDGSLLEIELPGVSKESVALDVQDRTLIVSGERNARRETVFGEEDEHDGTDRTDTATGEEGMESHDVDPEDREGEEEEPENGSADETGSKTRESSEEKMKYLAKFTLPASADASNARAELRDGLLVVFVPKSAPVTHKISIGL